MGLWWPVVRSGAPQSHAPGWTRFTALWSVLPRPLAPIPLPCSAATLTEGLLWAAHPGRHCGFSEPRINLTLLFISAARIQQFKVKMCFLLPCCLLPVHVASFWLIVCFS